MSIVDWLVDHAPIMGPIIGYVSIEAARALDAMERRRQQEAFEREARAAAERRYLPPAEMTGPHR